MYLYYFVARVRGYIYRLQYCALVAEEEIHHLKIRFCLMNNCSVSVIISLIFFSYKYINTEYAVLSGRFNEGQDDDDSIGFFIKSSICIICYEQIRTLSFRVQCSVHDGGPCFNSGPDIALPSCLVL